MRQISISEAIGDVKYGSTVYKEFDISAYINRAHYYDTSCGSCTKAVINPKKKILEVSIDTTKVGATEGQPSVFHKFVNLYLDPDVPEFVPDEHGKKVPNQKKEKVTFILTGTVE